jgi:2-hydroxycyclohexanecarboxyl-CoA dehydrogenase
MLRINLRGPFLVTQAVLPDMLAAGWGRIVSISSSSAQSGDPGLSHYAATKGGIMGWTRALALELAGTGVTANHIAPGMIDTPMLRAFDINVEELAAASPMKRAGSPADIAGAFAYFASEAAAYVTGQGINVNGGRYMQ